MNIVAVNHCVAYGGNNTRGSIEVATACRAKGGSGHGDFESETFVAHTLRGEGFDASEDGTGRGTPLVPMAGRTAQTGANGHGVTVGVAHTLDGSNPPAGDPCHPPPVAFGWMNAAAQGLPIDTISPTLDKSKHPTVMVAAAVRRLMPSECEALMGFPRGYTAIPWRGKVAADGLRYKALGNSWACNVARWVGMRINMVEQIRGAHKHSEVKS